MYKLLDLLRLGKKFAKGDAKRNSQSKKLGWQGWLERFEHQGGDTGVGWERVG